MHELVTGASDLSNRSLAKGRGAHVCTGARVEKRRASSRVQLLIVAAVGRQLLSFHREPSVSISLQSAVPLSTL